MGWSAWAALHLSKIFLDRRISSSFSSSASRRASRLSVQDMRGRGARGAREEGTRVRRREVRVEDGP